MSEMEKEMVNGTAGQETEPVEKAGETKAEKFIRIGEYRMNKALEAIGRLENLANRSAYEYTQEQAEAMFSVLESKVEDTKAKFAAQKQKEGTFFSFGAVTGGQA